MSFDIVECEMSQLSLLNTSKTLPKKIPFKAD